MQITLDKNEVEQIVLEAINSKFNVIKFNTVTFANSYSSEFATVTHEKREPE